MTDESSDVSRDTLDRLVARALEIEERGRDRISLTKAREIARESGITEAAWDAAVAERMSSAPLVKETRRRAWVKLPTLLTAGAGLAAGLLGGWLNRSLAGDADVVYGALLLVSGAVLATRARKESPVAAQTALDAWWVGVPAGLMAGMGAFTTDTLLFAAFARWGTGWIVSHYPVIVRLLRQAVSPTIDLTA